MAGRKDKDSVAFTAFANVEAAGAFEVRSKFGNDRQTKGGNKWAVYVGGWIFKEEKRGSSRAADRRTG